MKINKNKIISYLVFLQILTYVLLLKYDSQILLIPYYFLGGVTIFFIKKSLKIIVLVFGISILLAFWGLFSQEYPFITIISNIIQGGFAFLSAYALYSIRSSYKYMKLLFILYSLMLLYYFFIFGLGERDLYNTIFDIGSRNIVSAIYIFIFILFYMCCENEKEKVHFIYPAILFLFCLFLYGRSGILVSGVLLIYILWNKMNNIFRILSVFLLPLIIFYVYDDMGSYLLEDTSFSQGIESERSVILEDFLNIIKNDLYSLIFGVSFSRDLPIVVSYGNNPHNSFIFGHTLFGISHTIFFVIIYFYILLSRKSFYIILLSLIYFRYSLDKLGLFSPIDIVIFYLLISCYHSNNKENT